MQNRMTTISVGLLEQLVNFHHHLCSRIVGSNYQPGDARWNKVKSTPHKSHLLQGQNYRDGTWSDKWMGQRFEIFSKRWPFLPCSQSLLGLVGCWCNRVGSWWANFHSKLIFSQAWRLRKLETSIRWWGSWENESAWYFPRQILSLLRMFVKATWTGTTRLFPTIDQKQWATYHEKHTVAPWIRFKVVDDCWQAISDISSFLKSTADLSSVIKMLSISSTIPISVVTRMGIFQLETFERKLQF